MPFQISEQNQWTSGMRWFIKMFFKTLRLIIGPVILGLDKLTSPRGIKRPQGQQQHIDEQARSLVLYQFNTCPFCIKVKRHNRRLSLKIETRDAQHNPQYRQELLSGGGQIKVPCLKIVDTKGNDRWLYESDEIIQYLDERFAA